MTIQQSVMIGAAALSVAGVWLLYHFSGSGAPGGYVNQAIIEEARSRGARHLKWQRWGLFLSIIGIALGCASAFVR